MNFNQIQYKKCFPINGMETTDCLHFIDMESNREQDLSQKDYIDIDMNIESQEQV